MTTVGSAVAILGGLILWGFITSINFFPASNNFAGEEQALLKTSLGARAYGKLEVFQFLDKASPSVAAIYKEKTAAGGVADNLYLDRDRMGYGFVLTSDGWLVTNKNVIAGTAVKSLIAVVKGSVYSISSVVYDTWTDAVFLKIQAENLPVISLGDSGALKLGDIVFGGSGRNNFWFSYIGAINIYPKIQSKADIVFASEDFGKIIRLQDAIPAELNGGLMANAAGEVIGVAVANKTQSYILPVNYFKDAVADVLKNKKISRPYLGVDFIDLSFAIGEDLPADKGAYITGVAVGSPAEDAGLKAGDVITGVDGESVNEYANLSALISEYKAGEEITFKILRIGEEADVKVKLGSK